MSYINKPVCRVVGKPALGQKLSFLRSLFKTTAIKKELEIEERRLALKTMLEFRPTSKRNPTKKQIKAYRSKQKMKRGITK